MHKRATCVCTVALISSCLSASAHGSKPPSGATEVYHPGHSAHHVTRLHRWDHSGWDSMLEAEAQWHHRAADTEAAEVSARGTQRRQMRHHGTTPSLRAGSIEPHRVAPEKRYHRRWLRISQVQAEGLLQHHEESHASHRRLARSSESRTVRSERGQSEDAVAVNAADTKASSVLNRTSDLAFAESGGQVEYTVSDEKVAPGGALLQDLRKHMHRKSSPVHSGMAVTGLTSLSSQYVGPIGVGTVVAPSACVVHNGQNLQFVGRGVEERRRTGCHLEDESQVWVVFDTGSTNIWVSSDLCKDGSCVQPGRHRYNHSRSTTYDWPVAGLELTVQFGTGCIKGPQAVDDFHIGPFTVFNQTFGMIETQNGTVFNEVPFEGILGLAFSSMSANGVQPFFDTIIQQKALVHNEFAFYFSLDSVTANAVFWGGVDPAFFEGKIEYYPVIDPYYWAIELVSFKVGNQEFFPDFSGSDADAEPQAKLLDATDSAAVNAERERLSLDPDEDPPSAGEAGDDAALDDAGLAATPAKTPGQTWKAIVDTGTTFFTAEGEMYDQILALLLPVKCNEMTPESHPPIVYRLRSVSGKMIDFVLENHQYMTSGTTDKDAQCTPAFMRIDIPPKHGPAMVLGECFLRHYYSVLDRADGAPMNARVGFAKSKHDQKPIDQLVRLTRGQQVFQMPHMPGE